VSRTGPPRLVLASTSPYRHDLLGRLGLPFEARAPAVDEIPLAGEPPTALAARLARLKAESVARQLPDCVVIGSDQVAALGDEILGKPVTPERCIEQLRRSSGRTVVFLTAVHVAGPAPAASQSHLDRTTVHFRALADSEIERYVAVERPLDCAGGFRAESLGISLFESIESTDPTALTGLPLVWLCGALRRAGIAVP
jgi:septum formation protein